ncbi:ABC transporter substrate-binding protein, partial [bacterium]|nr:ABC transporter substrate-binding protein [bacterium]
FPMTGSYAAGGQMCMDGVNMAHKLRPQVLGKDVKVILVDDKSDKVESANAVSRLINAEKVVAVIGEYCSSDSIAGAEICEKAKIPMISPSATNPMVTQGKKYVFRACFIDPFQGKVMAKYAVDTLGAKNVVIIQDIAADYSVGLSSFFKKSFIELTKDDKSILEVLSYQTGDQDYTAQLVKTKSLNPDVIFMPGYFGDIALFARQAKDTGIKAPLLAGDGAQAPELIEIGGEAVEGLIFCTHYAPESSTEGVGKDFVEAYRKEYNKEPDAFSALGFDVYNMVIDVIQNAGEATPENIRNGFANLKDYNAVTGIITIDENGNANKNAVILQVKDGKFAFLDTVKPS